VTRARPLLAILLVAVTFAVFAPSLRNGFTNWDDPMMITENPVIRDLSPGNLFRIISTPDEYFYRPFLFLSLAMEYHFFRFDPLVYHLDNLMLHLCNTLLVFWLILLLTDSDLVAFLTAFLFGAHPMRVETVAWTSARAHLLYAFFFLLSLVLYLYYRRTGRRPYLVASIIVFVLSLISKIMAVTLPFAAMLFDYLREGKAGGERLKEKVPYFIVAVFFGLLTLTVHHFGRITEKLPAFGLLDRLSINCYAIAFYLVKLIFPLGLACYYPVPEKLGPVFYLLAPGALILLACAAAASARFTRKIVFGSLFFLITVLPTFQFVPTGLTLFADRYTYIPYIGLFYIVAEGTVWLWGRAKSGLARAAIACVLAVLAAALCFISWQRCLVWHDGLTLWSDDIARYPGSKIAYYNRASEYLARNDLARAKSDLEATLRIDPDYAPAHVNLGMLLLKEGRTESSLLEYGRAIALDPGRADAYLDRGNALCALGRRKEALEEYGRAIALDHEKAEAYFDRGLLLAQMGEYGGAVEDYGRAIWLDPRDAEALNDRGDAYFKLGRLSDALADIDRALELRPDFAAAYYNRAAVLYSTGEFRRAYADMQKAAQLGYPVDARELDLLRAAAER